MGAISNSEWVEYNEVFFAIEKKVSDIDYFIFLKCSIDENIKRIQKRNRNFDESKMMDYLKTLDEKYKYFKLFVNESLPHSKIFEIDTSDLSPEQVLAQVEHFIFSEFQKTQ